MTWATGTTTSTRACGGWDPPPEAASITQVKEAFKLVSKTSFWNSVFFEIGPFCVSATFTSNPQFVVRLEDVDEDPLDGEDGCTFLLGLMQKDGRRHKRLDHHLETIGFAIYKVSLNNLTFNA